MVENVNTKEYWDSRWSSADPMFSRKLEKILWGLVDPHLSVLDVGCGRGRLLKSLKKDKLCEVFGIDLSEVAIANLKRQGIPGMVLDAETDLEYFLPFDVVIISHTLEHIERDQKVIQDLWAITKQYCIIAVPNDCMGHDTEKEHLRTYTKESLMKKLNGYFHFIEDHSQGVHLILKGYA